MLSKVPGARGLRLSRHQVMYCSVPAIHLPLNVAAEPTVGDPVPAPWCTRCTLRRNEGCHANRVLRRRPARPQIRTPYARTPDSTCTGLLRRACQGHSPNPCSVPPTRTRVSGHFLATDKQEAAPPPGETAADLLKRGAEGTRTLDPLQRDGRIALLAADRGDWRRLGPSPLWPEPPPRSARVRGGSRPIERSPL